MKALLTSQLKTGSRFHSSCRLVSSTTSNRDHYSTLGVSRTADAKEIKSAFYELSKKYHPDRNPDDKAGSSIKFQDVGAVLLSNEVDFVRFRLLTPMRFCRMQAREKSTMQHLCLEDIPDHNRPKGGKL